MGLTIKEVRWRIEAIGERKNLDLRFQAKIHGAEIKNEEQKQTVSPEAAAHFNKLLEERKKWPIQSALK